MSAHALDSSSTWRAAGACVTSLTLCLAQNGACDTNGYARDWTRQRVLSDGQHPLRGTLQGSKGPAQPPPAVPPFPPPPVEPPAPPLPPAPPAPPPAFPPPSVFEPPAPPPSSFEPPAPVEPPEPAVVDAVVLAVVLAVV